MISTKLFESMYIFPYLYLNSLMTAQIKVKLRRMRDTNIDCCSSRNVPTFTALFFFIGTKQPGVVSLLYHNKRYTYKQKKDIIDIIQINIHYYLKLKRYTV